KWYLDHRLGLELFVLVNLAFLSLDIYLAHSVNDFGRRAPTAFGRGIEYVPLYFSLAAPGVLLAGLVVGEWGGFRPAWRDLRHLGLCAAVLLAQAAVGLLGFYYHAAADLRRPSGDWFENLVHGAPVLAPLLFPNLVLLALLGLWVLGRHLPPAAPVDEAALLR